MRLDAKGGIIDAIPLGVIVLDRSGTVTRANAAAETALGEGPLEGRNLFSDLPRVPSLGRAREAFSDAVRLDAVALNIGDERLRFRIRSFGEGDEAGAVAVVLTLTPEDAAGATADAHADMLKTVSRCRHDLNNSLMGLIGMLELLLMRGDVSGDARRKVDGAMVEAGKLRDRIKLLNSVR